MNAHLMSTVPAAAMLVACSSGSPPRSEPAPDMSPDIAALCQGVINAYECGRRVEQYQLARLPQYAARTGDTLVVRLAAGQEARFVDRNVQDASGVRYAYHEFLPAMGYHVVQVLLYEGTGYQLVGHATGNIVPVHAPPLVSPDGRRFATASEDLESGYNPTAIQIWRLDGHAAVLEWTLEPAGGPIRPAPDGWGPHDMRWITPTELRVMQVRLDAETNVRRVEGEVVIRLTNGEWSVLNQSDIGS
ncbi:MAG: hypothetical protein O7I93_13605 [Gemmatimonadetes bacterium]|nr:hypothetical protein [Gemmatimonadota bacterium]